MLRRPRKIGIGDAVRAGFAVGLDRGYDVVVQIDADLSHDPAALPELLAEIERGADAAIGSRYVPGGSIPHWPWYRRAVSKWGNRYATLVLGLPVRDADLGLPRVPRRHAEGRRLRQHALEGIRLPDRALLPDLAVRWPHRAGADRVHRPSARPLQDVAERRRRGARARHVVGAPGSRAQGALAPLTRSRSHFAWLLLAIIAVALGVRVSYVAIAKAGPCHIRNHSGKIVADQPTRCLEGDELFYNAEANFIANGHGFNQPYGILFEPNAKHRPAADHPPLTVLVLAPVSWLVQRPPLSWVIHEPLHDYAREDRYTMVVLGTILVGLVGLLGRRVGGETVGLVAAGIAAITPNLWVNDGLVMSETVTGLAVVGALLCAFRFWDRPSLRRAAALGAVCGLAALGARRVRVVRRAARGGRAVLRAPGGAHRPGCVRGRGGDVGAARDGAVGGVQPRALPRPHVHLDERRHHAGRRQLRGHVLRFGNRPVGPRLVHRQSQPAGRRVAAVDATSATGARVRETPPVAACRWWCSHASVEPGACTGRPTWWRSTPARIASVG